MKAALRIALKVLGLAVLLFICYAIAAPILGPQAGAQTPQEAAQGAAALLVVCLLDAIVITYLILRSRWWGWRLIAAGVVVFFGVGAVMPQIQAAVFPTKLPL